MLGDFLQKCKVSASAFCDFSLHLCKVLRLPRKSEARSYEVLHLSRKIILANLKIWCSKMQPLSGKSARWPPNISDGHVSCTAPATRNSSLQILFKRPTPANAFETGTKPSRFAHFWQGAESLAPATRNDIWTSKSGPEPCGVFNILTWKCASCHNGVHFLNISTSKNALNVCFVHFDFGMCFAPQRRTLFEHLNFEKCSERVFCTFWLWNVLRATTAYTFSTSQLPKVLEPVSFNTFDFQMCFAPQLRALFRHLNFQKRSDVGVFCTFWLGNVLRATTACNFSSLIWPDGSAPAALASLVFDPPEPESEKHSESRVFYFFAHLHLLFSDSFSSLISLLLSSFLLWLFPPLLFHLSILSEVWVLNFLWSCPDWVLQPRDWANFEQNKPHLDSVQAGVLDALVALKCHPDAALQRSACGALGILCAGKDPGRGPRAACAAKVGSCRGIPKNHLKLEHCIDIYGFGQGKLSLSLYICMYVCK